MKSFYLRHDIAHYSTRLIISSKFIHQILTLNIFHLKKTIEHLSCKLLPSCVQFRDVLDASRSANCHKSNEVSLNFSYFKSFSSIFQKSVRDSPKKASVLILLQKISSPQFFAEYFYKNIHNSRIKMFYQNRGHTFVF